LERYYKLYRASIIKISYPDIAIRDFAISEKVSGQSQKQFLFWDLRSKKAIADWCRVGGCRLQGEVRYIKVEL
jgi:hypothetical protein